MQLPFGRPSIEALIEALGDRHSGIRLMHLHILILDLQCLFDATLGALRLGMGCTKSESDSLLSYLWTCTIPALLLDSAPITCLAPACHALHNVFQDLRT